ncbi:MAG: N-acetylmuramic acid 6-phosphate etherase [Bacteroidales bacterium]|jgi:N-acetylmuramic acid 6-phosphate etherase|nr:N-acetylmuramic acid 6-phosphate etherase [Bacteroidales bacterium]
MNVTEQTSIYSDLDKMTTEELLRNMNNEDKTVPLAVEKCIPQIEKLVDGLVERMKEGGRLFYLGAGTSGRLGILDASEIPPTFGAPYDLIIGLIAGGDIAIRKAVENAEDDPEGGWNDLKPYHIDKRDTIVGIAASGSTPYVIGAVKKARAEGIFTGCITCNPDAALTKEVDVPIVAVVGPEFVTGSTRLKAGTAQKLILNMITTTSMIKLGHVKGNKMIDMQLTNTKLVKRGTRMIMEETGIKDPEKAKNMLLEYGSVRGAVDFYKSTL